MNDLFLIYGKIIIDSIQLRSGEVVTSTLGGGGPQAAFGARLWHSPVALLTRSGTDLDPAHMETLAQLELDLSGWARYGDLPTPRDLLQYDAQEYLHDKGLITTEADWNSLLSRPLPLSAEHQRAAGIHLVTEFAAEPMVVTALDLQTHGALCSLEPIFDAHSCPDPAALLNLARHVDLVTPDWPSAIRFADTDQPLTVVQFWAALGPQAVAVRHGAHGSYVWDRHHQQIWHIPGLPVPVVDPTGAGNAYGGGWCIGWHATHDALLSGCYATVAAALMVSHTGMPPLNDELRERAGQLFELARSQAVLLA